jgi:hypothetical protein
MLLGGGVVKVDWCEEKKREPRRESHPYIERPELLLHLYGVTLRLVWAPKAPQKQDQEWSGP